MSEIIYRWSGLLLIIGVAFLSTAIAIISLKPVVNQAFSPGVSLLLLIASILLLLSLPGMYAHQAEAAGWLGLVGFTLLQAGILLLVIVAAPALLYPSHNDAPGESLVAFLLGIALTLGLLLTGIATLRAGVFPRGSGILLLAATIGFFFDFFIAEFLPPMAGQLGSAIFGAMLAFSLIWIGISLFMGNPEIVSGNV